jgi:hypothetical protein
VLTQAEVHPEANLKRLEVRLRLTFGKRLRRAVLEEAQLMSTGVPSRAARRASSGDSAPTTVASITFVEPSASATIAFARSVHTCPSAEPNAGAVGWPSSISSPPPRPLARTTTMSFVLVSLSISIMLKELLTASFNVRDRKGSVTGASVVT